jgi:hypothetical protein
MLLLLEEDDYGIEAEPLGLVVVPHLLGLDGAHVLALGHSTYSPAHIFSYNSRYLPSNVILSRTTRTASTMEGTSAAKLSQ